MVTQLYVIYDKVAEEPSPIFQAKNDSHAIRSYTQAMIREPVPADFCLMCLGIFSSSSLILTAYSEPKEVYILPDEVNFDEDAK